MCKVSTGTKKMIRGPLTGPLSFLLEHFRLLLCSDGNLEVVDSCALRQLGGAGLKSWADILSNNELRVTINGDTLAIGRYAHDGRGVGMTDTRVHCRLLFGRWLFDSLNLQVHLLSHFHRGEHIY